MASTVSPINLTFVYEDEIKNHLANKSNWSYDYINEIGEKYHLRRKIEEEIPEEIDDNLMENDDLTNFDFDVVFKKIGWQDEGDFRESMNTLSDEDQREEIYKFFNVYIDLISDKFKT